MRAYLLDHDFSIAGGTLTPTMKARRAAITNQYQEQIDQLRAVRDIRAHEANAFVPVEATKKKRAPAKRKTSSARKTGARKKTVSRKAS